MDTFSCAGALLFFARISDAVRIFSDCFGAGDDSGSNSGSDESARFLRRFVTRPPFSYSIFDSHFFLRPRVFFIGSLS
jgi:hypothetical protein